ncbi:histone H1-like [Notolabrus celidotus]|uniref:histone H1-like n=1 Tax=Notolabrus celidotus TaxID=1203425 RepID=UPI00148F61E6|nr:histone H1-like [Notolabrus celidotus]
MVEEAATKKKRTSSRARTGLQLWKMIAAAVRISSGRKGTSVQAIKKCLKNEGVDVEKNNSHINRNIVRLTNKGVLIQVKGTGANGSFKLAKTLKEPKKPKAKKAVVKKAVVKKAVVKKATAKKVVTKKSPAKKTAVKRTVGKGTTKKAVTKTTAKKTTKKKTIKKISKTPSKKSKPAKKTLVKRVNTKKVIQKKTTAKKTKK